MKGFSLRRSSRDTRVMRCRTQSVRSEHSCIDAILDGYTSSGS